MSAVELKKEDFMQNVAGGASPSLVEFWAPWCTYCRRIGSAYEKVAEQYGSDMLVAKVNIDEEPELAEQYQVDVIPTLIYFKEGQPGGRIVAPESKARIDEFIKEQGGR